MYERRTALRIKHVKIKESHHVFHLPYCGIYTDRKPVVTVRSPDEELAVTVMAVRTFPSRINKVHKLHIKRSWPNCILREIKTIKIKYCFYVECNCWLTKGRRGYLKPSSMIDSHWFLALMSIQMFCFKSFFGRLHNSIIRLFNSIN